jgi:hypothetical protein
MTCPYLEYRPLVDTGNSADSGDSGTGEPRAFCTAAQQFVQPMRADICNDRYDLDHQTDCEIYRDAEGLSEVPDAENAVDAKNGGAGGESE